MLTERGTAKSLFIKGSSKRNERRNYLDWTEGELGYAPTTGTIALSNNAGPMKWNDEEQKDPSKRAYNLARQVEGMPKEVFDMVVSYKKIQNRALKKLNQIEKEYGPEIMNEE